MVNHSILLLKLHDYGIRGVAYNWFQSYLSNRQQFVCTNGHDSNHLSINCRVPQGSVLGPLLFLLYINDLPNASESLTFHLFADDTNILYLFGYKPISAISRDPKIITQKINLINTNCKCIILGYKPRAIFSLEVYCRPWNFRENTK